MKSETSKINSYHCQEVPLPPITSSLCSDLNAQISSKAGKRLRIRFASNQYYRKLNRVGS
ncbi:hypothetical protein V6Z11_D09G059100 [Gossypium hirsutum]